ncbi:MAG TPA: S41 family peptidase [Candidatus Brocadiales bacterium]|nr:S41 family peptidase [Candidatus Brocadiales bacterium]
MKLNIPALLIALLLLLSSPCLAEEVVAVPVPEPSTVQGGGPPPLPSYDEYYKNYEEFVRVVKLIQEKYVKDIKLPELFQGAYRGMLEGLDPYSQYFGPEELEELKVETEGKFGGLGIEVVVRGGVLYVISPILDSPAFRAGVMVGDRIIKIEGTSTESMSLRDAVRRLRGEPNTGVTITVVHQGETQPVDIVIVRDIIQVHCIRGARIVDEEAKIGYMALISFQDNTLEEMDKAFNELMGKGMKALILDLRFNPGGLLNMAVAVSDRFLSQGVIVSTKGREEEQNQVYLATEGGTYSDLPLVILVNNGSASAAEIVAGAIQDYKRGLIVGTRTFGKGSVQSLIGVEEEHCALKLTTALYYTPSGRSIDHIGIEPDVKVELTPAETKSLHEYLSKVNITSQTGEQLPQEDTFVDLQLHRAVEIIKEGKFSLYLLSSVEATNEPPLLKNVNPGH